MANLTSFKNRIGYGVRPNLFQVTIPTLGNNIEGITNSSDITGSDPDFTFLCRSAGIPASTVGTVEVPFRGRVIKLPGDRTFESWTVTIMADEDLKIRAFFEKWLDSLNRHEDGAGYTENYSATLKVEQLKRGTTVGEAINEPHSVVRGYTFKNAFPSNLSQIDLSYDNNNSIAEYTVEFQYDWWEADGQGQARVGDGAPI